MVARDWPLLAAGVGLALYTLIRAGHVAPRSHAALNDVMGLPSKTELALLWVSTIACVAGALYELLHTAIWP